MAAQINKFLIFRGASNERAIRDPHKVAETKKPINLMRPIRATPPAKKKEFSDYIFPMALDLHL